MVSKFLKTCLLFGLLFWATTAFAQPVQVSVALAPPYPVHLEDYAQMKGQMIVTLVNTSQTLLQLRLVPSVQGQNGISATLKPGYRPATPLTLGPLQTMVLTGGQLQALNMGLSLQNLDLKGISVQQIIRTETLPEGLYDLCIRAFDFNSETQLSKDGLGCAPFNITWYDPPVIVTPADKAQVTPLNPQFLNIGWTPSGIGGITRYRLLMMDMTANGLANANDAFDMGFPPFFEKEYLITLGYPVSSAEPPLTIGHKYALRVQAYDPQGNLKFKNDGRSAVSTFTYGLLLNGTIVPTGGGGGIDIPFDDFANTPQDPIFNLPDPDDPNTCMSSAACEIAMPSSATTYDAKAGDTVLIGKFRLIISSIAGGSGEGKIYVPFLKTRLKVKFQNLQVNGQKQAYGNSKAWADIDNANLVEQAMANDPNGNLGNVKVKELNDYLNGANRVVSKMAGEQSQPIGVPLAIDNAKKQNLILLGLIFGPTKAQANVVFGMPVPEAMANEWLQLGTKGICLRPNGFGVDAGKISLTADKSVALTDHTNFLAYGGADKTYVEFTCTGITKVQLNGGIEFSRAKALPVDAQGKVVAAPAKLVAKFNTTIDNALNWTATATLSHPKFSLPAAQDILFSPQNLMIDQSSTSNVQGMKFPANHPNKNQVSWRGVYLGTVTISMPAWLKDTKKGAPVAAIGLNDLLMDKTGLWAKVQVTGVMPKLDDGEAAGWAFSVDTIRLTIESSQLTGGGLAGFLRLPVCETGVKYSATIAAGDPDADFSFGVTTTDEVTIDAFIAKAVFGPNSSITFPKVDGKYSPTADVNGTITVGWKEEDDDAQKDNAVSAFSLPSLHFSQLLIQNNAQGKPRVNVFNIEWDNPNVQQDKQSKLAGFPLKLADLGVVCDGNVLNLKLDLDITLTKGEAGKNGLVGSTGFTIHGKYNDAKKCYVYEKTTINSIGIDVMLSVAEVKGSLELYKKDPSFGNGFKGSISATIKGIGIGLAATLQVGNMGTYDYFFFDGLFKYDQGFKIPGAAMASIYGFGGGVWYNMKPTGNGLGNFSYADYGTAKGDTSKIGVTASGVAYVPSKDDMGFKAKVIFGLSGGADKGGRTFNGDLTFTMELSKQFGLNKITLDGNGYMLQKMESRGDAKIEGHVFMEMNFVEPSFTLLAGLELNMGKVLSGSATLNMHFSPDNWYVHLGKWSTKEYDGMAPWAATADNTRCRLSVDLPVLSAKVGCYFMIGSDMPELPPLPANIRDVMEDQNHKAVNDSRPAFAGFSEAQPGFGFGAALNTHLDISVLIVYASIDFTLGFDVLLKQYTPDMTCDGSAFGINNWYAKGQAYAQLDMELGLQLNLWFWKSEQWKLFDVNATAVLYGSFPNPNYFAGKLVVKGEALNGMVKVNRSFNFETGEKPCLNNSPFGQYPIVANLDPAKSDKIAAYQDVRIAFNFPKGYFEVANDMEPEIPAKSYRYKIEKFEITQGTKKIALKAIEYVDEYRGHYQCAAQYGLWPENAGLHLHMELNGYEKGKAAPVDKSFEKYDYGFETGEWPDKIDFAMVKESSPQPNKRYFINNGSLGFVKYKSGNDQGYVFDPQRDDKKQYDVSKTKFYTVFTELTTGKRTIGTFTHSTGKIEFPIPQDLKKSAIYSFEIIKELSTWPKGEDEDPNNPDVGGGWGGGDSNGNSQGGQYTGAEWKELYGGGVYRLNRLLLPDNATKRVYVAMCRIYFRTSKFNSMEQKVATYQVKATGYLPNVTYQRIIKATPQGDKFTYSVEEDKKVTTECPILFLSGNEPFDEYDAYGYTLDAGYSDIKVAPHVKLSQGAGSNFPTRYYERYNGFVDASDVEIKSFFVGRDYFGSGWPFISDVHTPEIKDLEHRATWSPYLQFWRNSKFGNINSYAPGNLSVGLPAKVLSKAEIDAAKAQAPQEGGFSINDFAINVHTPPMLPGLGLGVDPASICVPVVDLSGFVINRDYCYYMRDGWGYYKDHYDEASKRLWLHNIYDYLQDYLKPRSEAAQSVDMNGHTLNYNYKKY